MPRLFSGIELPLSIKTRLSLLRGPISGARWIDPEDMHLTLYFAGDIDNDVAQDWSNRLDLITFAAFDITVTGLGVFGKSRPRSLWAAIAPNEQLLLLQKEHRKAAHLAGIRPEVNPYKPHITLARFNGASTDTITNYTAQNASMICAPFTAQRAVMFSARPNRGGGPYPVEESYPFIGQGSNRETAE